MKQNRYNLDRLRSAIKPFRVHFFTHLRSTNDHATRMRKQRRLFAPAMVLAGNQTHGRGRGRNVWWSSPGCITVTLALPVDERLEPHQVPLLAGVAVRAALANVSGEQRLQLKWPNDLLFRGRKLAGILCERVAGVDLIGLGINVNLEPGDVPSHLRGAITSLSEITGRSLDKTDVLIAVARGVHTTLARRDEYPFPAMLREYDLHHYLRGRRVCIRPNSPDAQPVRGTCVGLDRIGRLLVRRRSRQVPVVAGHVQLI